MEGNVDLFEIAKQIATPEYVASKIEQAQAAAHASEIGAIISGCVFIIGIALLVAGIIINSKNRESASCLVLGTIGTLLAICSCLPLIVNVIAVVNLPLNLAPWMNDPVTKVAGMLMSAIK